MIKLNIPDSVVSGIAEAEREFCERVRKCDPDEGARALASGHEVSFGTLVFYFGEEKLRSMKILEVGCGNGFFLTYALVNGLEITGIEPGANFGFEGRRERAISLMRHNSIANPEDHLLDAVSESLPFEDETFDLVFSIAVLEHVNDVDASMKEAIRVLKPGGALLAHLPDYNSLHEAHYNIPWIPFISKAMARIYVSKIWGRDPSFVDELNFTKPSEFYKYIESKETSGLILHHGGSSTDNLFSRTNYNSLCSSVAPAPVRKNGSGALSVKDRVVMLICKVLMFFGFSPSFTVILEKRAEKADIDG